jgi:hypothetical protein
MLVLQRAISMAGRIGFFTVMILEYAGCRQSERMTAVTARPAIGRSVRNAASTMLAIR